MAIDRPKEPPKFDDDDFGEFPSERPTAPAPADSEERPTLSPPYDVEEFAKASDSKVRAARTPAPEREANAAPRPAPPVRMPPQGSAATRPPPVPDFDLTEDIPDLLGPGVQTSVRPPQITLTDEDELETARLRSVLLPSEVPPRRKSDPVSSEPPPATVAYPADFEKDPFAQLDVPSGRPPGGAAARQLRDMNDKFSLGDYTGALEAAEGLLRADPVNGEALACAEACREKLQQMYTARIGPLDRVPVVIVAREQLRWLSIDHRAGFLLSHIDGVSSLEMILDVSGMPLLDALKILYELAQQRVITFR